MKIDGKTAKGYYQSLEPDRQPYLQRARDVSTLTIPTLMPPDGFRSGQDLPTPYQGLGARGVNGLASKLMLALFPPNQSFMRLKISTADLNQLGGGKVKSEVEASLAKVEDSVHGEIEKLNLRPRLHEVKKHLLVAGNVLLYIPPDSDKTGDKVKVIHLDNYVVRRDPSGNVLGIVVRECISLELIPDDLKAKVVTAGNQINDNTIDIYTAIVLKDNKYHVFQEVEGEVLPDSIGSYVKDELPWVPLRMEPIAGQSYGYGYLASLLGDLSSLEGLWKALLESSAISARTVFLVNPTSSTRPDQLNKAPNGAFVTGMPDDVVPIRVDKGADMNIAFQAIERLERSLGLAFLMNQSVQRSGERVTAEEWRILAQELEDVLAGTYSLLSQEEQLPIVRLILRRLERSGSIPKIEGVATPVIVTGLEALGRGHDLAKLDTFVQGAGQVLGPDVLTQYMNVSTYLTRRATAVGLTIEDLIRSEDEVQQRQTAAAQAQTLQDVAPEAVRQLGNAAQNAGAA